MDGASFPVACNRLTGGSVKDCACRLPEGGWLECPPEARGVLMAIKGQLHCPFRRASPDCLERHYLGMPCPVEPEPSAITNAGSLTGDFCAECGSTQMVRAGTCLLCRDCGSTTGGCS